MRVLLPILRLEQTFGDYSLSFDDAAVQDRLVVAISDACASVVDTIAEILDIDDSKDDIINFARRAK